MFMDIRKECSGAERIAVGGHERPDGDCVGACLALGRYLQKLLPKAVVEVFLEPPSDSYACLKGFEEIRTALPENKQYDVFFLLDCEMSRMGVFQELFERADKTINIDHHISNENGCAQINHIRPQVSSTSELVYTLMEKQLVDAEIAKAVYLGMIHDTGVFQYSNTTPQTLRIAAELIEYGFDFPKMIDESFYEKTYIQNQILGRALLESILFMDGRCICSVIDRKTMDFYDAGPKDLDGIVNQLRIIRGVECAVFLYQTGVLEYKVSMRSCGRVDVAQIACYFGGGGHVRAAGCTMNGTFHDVINNLSIHIEKQLKEQDEA